VAKRLKQRIHEGETIEVVGVATDIERGRLEEILAIREFDLIAIDSQHSAHNEERIVSFCELAREFEVPTRIRIKHTRHAYLVGTYLDLGPGGVMIPEVEEESTVDEALAAFYYPQQGRRSWGGLTRDGLDQSLDRLAYAEWWNNHGTLTLQIESVRAVLDARKLAKPGVDMLSFGANDLLFSIEASRGYPFKTVDECVKHVISEVSDLPVGVGVRAENGEERDQARELGATILIERIEC
tara:strand:- start:180 stop:899 length:720 start_codon:yes stop_codon:yes gene_type:complete